MDGIPEEKEDGGWDIEWIKPDIGGNKISPGKIFNF